MRIRWLLLGFGIAIGCTDSSDARFPVVDGKPNGSGGRSGAAATGGGPQTGGASQTGGRSGALDAGPDLSTGGASGGAGGSAGTDAGTDADLTDDGPSVIVAYDIRSTEKKLYVLDPETGRPLSSEPIGTVRAVVNDGASYPDDRWYVFEQTNTVDRGVTIHVRRLTDGFSFQELGAFQDAPAVVGRAVAFGAAGKSFVAYLSELPTSPLSRMDLVLTVVDATDAANPKLLPSTGTFPIATKLGLVADGDSLDILTVQTAPCPTAQSGSQECNVSVVHATVTRSAVTIGAATIVGKTGTDGNAEFVVDPSRHEGLIGIPPVAPPPSPSCNATSRSTGSARTFSIDTAAPGPSVSIPVEAPRFAGAAFDTCSSVLFLTSLVDDVAVWAVPFGASATTTKLCAGSPGGPLFYDSSSRSLFRAASSGGLEAYRVDASGSAPMLTARALPDLPAGFQFGALAVRNPRAPACR